MKKKTYINLAHILVFVYIAFWTMLNFVFGWGAHQEGATEIKLREFCHEILVLAVIAYLIPATKIYERYIEETDKTKEP